MSQVSERFWETCIYQVARKMRSDYEMARNDLDCVGTVYESAGGTWESLATGDTKAWDLLRRVCKIYFKRRLKSKDTDEE